MAEQNVAWWVALAHQPDKLIEMAEGQLDTMKSAHEKAYATAGKISRAEHNRHSVKMAAVDRLMKPAAEGEKGRSFTAAESIVSTDEQYRDYLNRMADLQVELDQHRHTAEVARLRFRLIEQALRRAVDEEPIFIAQEEPKK